ncbi:MAG: type II CRISPR RNA-guided endonuclease Cas9 [Pseudomonadota bacterium]
MRYRLGLDLGANSIGWCAVKLSDNEETVGAEMCYSLGVDIAVNSIGWCALADNAILDAGVRILTPSEEAGRDPQSKASLAADRRDARAQRRRRDRFLQRRKRLMQMLIDHGLMPTDEKARKALEKLDPYWLRAAALNERIDLHELGRAIFHINQRRGFKSNRLADSDDNEKSATKIGMQKLTHALHEQEAQTLGAFLSGAHQRDKFGYIVDENGKRSGKKHGNPRGKPVVGPVRFRPTTVGKKNSYDLYPMRDMIAHELDAIWQEQAKHHHQLTDELLETIKHAIIDQRPLKKPIVGRCTLRPEENKVERYGIEIDLGERAPKAHPLFQRYRILQEVSNLRVTQHGKEERHLTLQERDALVSVLMTRSGHIVDFATMRKGAKLSEDIRFNHELTGRKGFAPDQTAAKLGARKMFGATRRGLARERQIEVVEKLVATENHEELAEWLQSEFDLEPERAEAISEARLPQGHGAFGRGVLADIVDVMEKEVVETCDENTGEVYDRPIMFNEACEKLELHHSDLRAEGTAARLPYYGEALRRHVISRAGAPEGSQEQIGRVPNPTVHIGLNQLQKIVNALIDEYGPPAEIAVELARELKQNKERKDKIQRENKENEQKNLERRALLENLGIADTHEARLRLRLYEELPADERVCVYTGENIGSLAELFTNFEIDHILPFSKTLDDSFMNKVLCMRAANREKGARAPGNVWSGDALQEIVERAERLFPKKAWRFQPDAMKRFDEKGGFLARHLNDTQHMARLAKTYLEEVCDQVWAPPGRLVGQLRGKWGLNPLLPDHNYANVNQPKNRKDHRHHAIDAFVVACTDRGLLQRVAHASARAEDLDLDRLFPKGEFPEPYEGFREDLAARLEKIIVSHKPDHGLQPGAQENVHVTSGQLHEETAYGLVDEKIGDKHFNLVTRKAITALTKGEIPRVRDAALREALQTLAYEAEGAGKKLSDALKEYGEENRVFRVRILKTEKSVRVVRHGDGFEKAYSPGDNHRMEIFETPDGEWAGEGVTVFDANQPGFKPVWIQENPAAKLVMRVHNGDLIEADLGDGRRLIYRVYWLEPSSKRMRVAAHNEAGSIDKRHNDPDDPLRWIFASYARLKAGGARRVRVDELGRVFPARDR